VTLQEIRQQSALGGTRNHRDLRARYAEQRDRGMTREQLLHAFVQPMDRMQLNAAMPDRDQHVVPQSGAMLAVPGPKAHDIRVAGGSGRCQALRVLEEVRGFIERAGVLLEHDARWPSVSTMVAGEPVRGSWWGHPAGQAIFRVMGELEDEVALPKLLGGKVTLVHRRLWPALVAVGQARADWQTRKLKEDAADVLELVDAEGSIRSDDVELEPGCRAMSAIVTDLEKRLLLSSHQQHTESGKHVRVLQSWKAFAGQLGRLPKLADAQRELEDAAVAFGGADAVGLLPWR
jgi:hypothetical protein